MDKWIAVTDAWPDESAGWVLVAMPLEPFEREQKIRLAHWSEERRQFVSQTGQSIRVTHWRVLPPGPETQAPTPNPSPASGRGE